jgi:hypothetical protein
VVHQLAFLIFLKLLEPIQRQRCVLLQVLECLSMRERLKKDALRLRPWAGPSSRNMRFRWRAGLGDSFASLCRSKTYFFAFVRPCGELAALCRVLHRMVE